MPAACLARSLARRARRPPAPEAPGLCPPLGSRLRPAATCARGVPPTTCGLTSTGSAQSSTSPSASPTTSPAEAEQRAAAPVDTAGRVDLTNVPWVTIDPPGSSGPRPGHAPGASQRPATGCATRSPTCPRSSRRGPGRTGGPATGQTLYARTPAPSPHSRPRARPACCPVRCGRRTCSHPARRRRRAHRGTG